MKRAFTLLEMLISVTLLSMIMLFLYQSLSTLQQGNKIYGDRLDETSQKQKILKTLYLDLSLAERGSLLVINRGKAYDIVLMQTSNSIHQRIMPYVGYIINRNGLFRIESSKKFNYPLLGDEEMALDKLGKVKQFRVYLTKTHALVDTQLDGGSETLFKVRLLNY